MIPHTFEWNINSNKITKPKKQTKKITSNNRVFVDETNFYTSRNNNTSNSRLNNNQVAISTTNNDILSVSGLSELSIINNNITTHDLQFDTPPFPSLLLDIESVQQEALLFPLNNNETSTLFNSVLNFNPLTPARSYFSPSRIPDKLTPEDGFVHPFWRTPEGKAWKERLEIERLHDVFASDEEREFNERLRFFVIPEGGEIASRINLPIFPPEYNLLRVIEIEIMIERAILLRMNPDATRNVTWRQNMCFDLPSGPITDLFLQKRISSAEPMLKTTTKKRFAIEGKSSQSLSVTTMIFMWQSKDQFRLPNLHTSHWYLKKWEGKNNLFRAECTELKFVIRPELDKVRVEFRYDCEMFNQQVGVNGKWQQR